VKTSVSVGLKGTAQPGALSLPGTPFTKPVATLDFGKVTVGRTSAPQTVTIKNTGLGLLRVTVSADPKQLVNAFQVASSGVGTFKLPNGQTKEVSVKFTPPSKGQLVGFFTISSDDPNSGLVYVKLTGTGQ